jgi:hypothetical protein
MSPEEFLGATLHLNFLKTLPEMGLDIVTSK